VDLSSNSVLVTGGASGIGLAFAERFVEAGSRVLVCGRREDRLAEVRERHPGMATYACNLAVPSEREALAGWLSREWPPLDVLVNNAGIQRRVDFARPEDWQATHEEIAINLEAPVHLSSLLAPQLARQPRAAIINITSGLALVPMARVGIYCASKAALRSYTLSLRRQLRDTSIRVIEVLPPAVDTDLGGPGLHTFGVPVGELADYVFARLAGGDEEIAYGFARESLNATPKERDAIFDRMNR
jgi:uncharacterized oxidoreductase